MGKGNSRSERVAAQMQRALAALLAREVKDPRVGSVTITAVTLAPDMSAARVLFLPFAGRHSGAEVSAGLASAAGFLRGEVARQLGLRHAPRLEFELDTGLERAEQLTRLIDTAVRDDRVRAGADADAPAGAAAPRDD
jgi:ribosome-binding factor A